MRPRSGAAPGSALCYSATGSLCPSTLKTPLRGNTAIVVEYHPAFVLIQCAGRPDTEASPLPSTTKPPATSKSTPDSRNVTTTKWSLKLIRGASPRISCFAQHLAKALASGTSSVEGLNAGPPPSETRPTSDHHKAGRTTDFSC